jgi:glycosyltransferase involved in cell wall biosynthesis
MSPDEGTRFSVLLPVYGGDRAEFLRRAFASCTVEQSLPPDDVVVVQDGPVGADLDRTLTELVASDPRRVQRVVLPRNVGLARALERGLLAVRHDIVARADADDISMPGRFAAQVPLVAAGLDLVGSAIVEFVDEDAPGIVRVPPLTAAAIARYARFHDPFNHPSVVYRRSAVASSGGYRDLPLMEDYWLFARMIGDGARVANVPEPLVMYRVGAGAYRRRGGLRLLRSELALQRHLREEGFTSGAQFVRNVVVRGGYRVVPEALRRTAYRTFIIGRQR